MIWATVCSQSWFFVFVFVFFFWLYSFSTLGCKEYNQSDFTIDHLVVSMCWVFYSVSGRGSLLWPVCSLGKTLLIFSRLHFVLQGQICQLLKVSINFLLLHSSPLWWKGHLYWVLVLEDLLGVRRTVQCFFSITGWGIDLDYSDIKLFALETEIILSFLRLHLSTAFWTLFLDWKRSVFIPIPKKGNHKECSNYCTIALISHISKVMLKILQVRLQQYMNHELPDV